MLLLLLVSTLLLGSTLGQQQLKLTDAEINSWVNSLSEEIENIRLKLGIEGFESAFESNGVAPDTVDVTKGETIMKGIKDKLEKYLYKYEEHVERIRIQAENAFAGHVFRNYSSNCIELQDQPFLRATALLKVKPDPTAANSSQQQQQQPPQQQQQHQQQPPQQQHDQQAPHIQHSTQQVPIITVVPQSESIENLCSNPTSMELTPDPRVYNVDTNRAVSTAHVPSNIYDASTEILNIANWSRIIDQVFIANAESDPMLKWQYFGNTEGLFKIYPGIQWYIQTRDLGNKDTTIDFFDCRTQYWYLLAASYPKDMVILLDNSGSMKGRRSIIANMTLTELLYTLNVNDFFNVIMFMNGSLRYVSEASAFSLLQATEKNKYSIMQMIKEDEDSLPGERRYSPLGISDYEEAIRGAFGLLDYVKTNATHMTSGGVQNIVVISDGAPQDFGELFRTLNPDRQVRVFTFLVGHEAGEGENVKKIACSNRGYFVQISTLSDVKENVQRYIPVIARTNAHVRDYFFVWTGVHRNQIKTQNPNAIRVTHTTDTMQSMTATSPSSGFTVLPFQDISTTTSTVQTTPTTTTQPPPPVNGSQARKFHSDFKVVYRPKMDSGPHVIQEEDPTVKNRLFISVAQSAYDIRHNETLSRGIGRLIGVSGLDLPLEHLEGQGPAWELGALGYIFIVTNNGHLLFHPEFKPFDNHGNLRMFFNNRDIADIESPADEEPEYNAPSYSQPLRLSLIQRETGITEMERIKAYEDFTRGFKLKFKYFYAPLNSTSSNGSVSRATPFSLALALPWRGEHQWPPPLTYASNFRPKDLPEDEVAKILARLVNNTCDKVGQSSYQVGLIDFEFCQFPSALLRDYNSNPLCAMVKVLQSNEQNQTLMKCSTEFLKRIYTDAISTESAVATWKSIDNATLQHIGASQFFLWTNNGLIRWHNHTKPLQPDFIGSSRNASRESIYEKSVLLTADSEVPISVISVPTSHQVQDALKANATFPRAFPILLTSLIRSKQLDSSKSRSPIGLAGVELDYAKLEETFMRVTNSCADSSSTTCITCSQLNVQCYLLDHAGFVAVSEVRQDVGKAFDQINCAAMRTLVKENYFTSTRIFDYQAICVRKRLISSSSTITRGNPIRSLMRFSSWLLLESFLFLMDVSSSVFQAFKSMAQEIFIQLSKENCSEIESRKAYQVFELRKQIDSKVDEVANIVRAKANEKTDEIKKSLVQPYCIAMQGQDQEACDHLCRRLRLKFDSSVYNDLLGNCPKRIIRETDCVLKRNLVKWTGKLTPSDTQHDEITRTCSDFGYCTGGETCSTAAKFQLHIRALPKTNLVFLAVIGDPNCNCRGCEDLVGMTELSAPPVNYSVPAVQRARPPWGLKNVVLMDNATLCSKPASTNAQPFSPWLLFTIASASLVAAISL